MPEVGPTPRTGAPTDAARVEKRRGWLAVLAKASLDELEAAWRSLPDKPLYRVLRPAETGLVMVRGRVGGTGQPFNMGEMTMTRAAVQLLDAANAVTYAGFGHVAGRLKRRAELVAVFDALLQDPHRQEAVAAAVVTPLAAGQRAERATRAGRVAATKVDFLTMVRSE
jgi:alpha-D-ribose 1-methylphosphonate 5-triphosphate synthase subunit PhnG